SRSADVKIGGKFPGLIIIKRNSGTPVVPFGKIAYNSRLCIPVQGWSKIDIRPSLKIHIMVERISQHVVLYDRHGVFVIDLEIVRLVGVASIWKFREIGGRLGHGGQEKIGRTLPRCGSVPPAHSYVR